MDNGYIHYAGMPSLFVLVRLGLGPPLQRQHEQIISYEERDSCYRHLEIPFVQVECAVPDNDQDYDNLYGSSYSFQFEPSLSVRPFLLKPLSGIAAQVYYDTATPEC